MVEPFDLDNPWHSHVFFAQGFWCDACNKDYLPCTVQESGSEAWCVELARLAFEAGWVISHPLPDGRHDFMNAFCPECAAQRGLTRPPYASITPTI